MSSSRSGHRRYHQTRGHQVWVFSELNGELRPEQVARIITAAGLEQARREADARADAEQRAEEEAGHA